MPDAKPTPTVVITGAAGNIGVSLTRALRERYTIVGMDRSPAKACDDFIEIDLSSDTSVAAAFKTLRERHGTRVAAVVHLAAYFDFTGEDHPLYEQVNVAGTRRLLHVLKDFGFEVGRLIYSGTMLVHAPAQPGERVTEDTPLAPKWAYPRSKAASEAEIRRNHGSIPYVLLHFAGLYDDRSAVPTLAQQIARVYERSFKSHFYPGDLAVGQSLVHKDDAIDALVRTVERRDTLANGLTILIGEPDVIGFADLQDLLARLIHKEGSWPTVQVPKAVAKSAAWAQMHAEPVVPDALDKGKKPFIRPFMVDMADDHYALDVSRAREILGWQPRRSIRDTLPKIVAALRQDPAAWYKANGIDQPPWMEATTRADEHPGIVRDLYQQRFRAQHRESIWCHFLNIGVASWLVVAPATLGYSDTPVGWSDIAAGIFLFIFAALSLSWRHAWARWASAVVGVWLLFAPLAFWTPSAAAYLNDTLIGTIAIALALLAPPAPGVSAIAAMRGPTTPEGWSFNPSAWTQRIPIIVLAFVGLHVSRYLAAYQLGHIDDIWDPFFAGRASDPQNGTEEIITSSVSEAWPVSDAGVGALTYVLEILTGIIGTVQRWRTMPWLVIGFGVMIVPLGVVSITFIIIQPIVIGTWCTLCLIAAAAMLVQIPYSLDELAATTGFLARRKKAGASLLRVFFVGDVDQGADRKEDDFERPPMAVLKDIWGGGVHLTWTLGAAMLIGIWLMLTRLTLGATGGMANVDHVVGALVITVAVVACAEIGRALRWLLVPLALGLVAAPFVYEASTVRLINSSMCGVVLILLSIRRGVITNRYGEWDRFIV